MELPPRNKVTRNIYILLSFFSGVLLASFLNHKYLSNNFYWFLILLSSSLLLIYFWNNKKKRFLLFLFLFFILALWRYSFALQGELNSKLSFYYDKKIDLEGAVLKPLEKSKNKNQTIVNIETIFLAGQKIKINEKILIFTKDSSFSYGDTLRIKGKFSAPKAFSDFDYKRYLAQSNIHSISYYPEIKIISSRDGNIFFRTIFYWRKNIQSYLRSNLNEKSFAIAQAIILGEKKMINSDLRDDFSRSGLSHILAISGLHVMILSLISFYFLIFIGFNRRSSFYVLFLFWIFYLFLIAFPASATRAVFIILSVSIAYHFGRLSSPVQSLFYAAFLMLLINSFLLRDNVGFVLSFGAVFGILYFFPRFEKMYSSFCKQINYFPLFFKKIFDAINISLSAQIFIIPFLVWNFKQISFISLLANLFIIWLVPFLLFFLLAGIFFSVLNIFLAAWFFALAEKLIGVIIFWADFFANIPYAFLEISRDEYFFFLILYIIFLEFIFLISKEKEVESSELILE